MILTRDGHRDDFDSFDSVISDRGNVCVYVCPLNVRLLANRRLIRDEHVRILTSQNLRHVYTRRALMSLSEVKLIDSTFYKVLNHEKLCYCLVIMYSDIKTKILT